MVSEVDKWGSESQTVHVVAFGDFFANTVPVDLLNGLRLAVFIFDVLQVRLWVVVVMMMMVMATSAKVTMAMTMTTMSVM